MIGTWPYIWGDEIHLSEVLVGFAKDFIESPTRRQHLKASVALLPAIIGRAHPAEYEDISCKEWVGLRVKAMHTIQ